LTDDKRPQKGELIIIGPGPDGKTALAINIAQTRPAARRKGGVFSLEMSKASLLRRMCLPASVDQQKLQRASWP